MRVLLTSDLQLDAAAAHGRFADNAATLDRIRELAEERQVELVIVAGDVFQHRKPGVDELLVFKRWLCELPCEVALLAGNHDVRGPHLPATIELFADAGAWPAWRVAELPVRAFTRPAVHLFRSALERPDVVVGFLPWAHPATIRAKVGGDRDALAETLLRVAADLMAEAGGDAIAEGDAIPILVTHHALDGMALPLGTPVRELMAETILDPHELLEQGWRSVFAGHVHAAGVVECRATGGTAYSLGPPWRHDFGERLIVPAVTLYDSAEDYVERIELDDRRFVSIEAELADFGPGIGVGLANPSYSGDVADAIVRVRVRTTPDLASRLDVAQVRRDLIAAGAHVVARVEVNVDRPTRARSETIADAGDPLAELDAYIEAAEVDRADELRELTRELLLEGEGR